MSDTPDSNPSEDKSGEMPPELKKMLADLGTASVNGMAEDLLRKAAQVAEIGGKCIFSAVVTPKSDPEVASCVIVISGRMDKDLLVDLALYADRVLQDAFPGGVKGMSRGGLHYEKKDDQPDADAA